MANPRLDAILGQLGGMEAPPPEPQMPPEEAGGADPVMDAMAMLEPLAAGDPRIAQVISMLQEIASGPPELPEDTVQEEPGELPAEEMV